MNDHELFGTLKTLDAAPAVELDADARLRAARGKARILSTPISPQSTKAARSPMRRWPVAAAGLAAATVTGLIISDMIMPSSAAYASWTATPAAVTAPDLAAATSACDQADGQSSGDVLLAERRGDWVALASVTAQNIVASCLVHLPVGASEADEVATGVVAGPGTALADGEFSSDAIAEFGTTGSADGAQIPASFNVGDVGPDVAALDITTPDGDVVQATVEDGHFVAWWPGAAFGDSGMAPDLSYRVTLVDGTVIDDAQPVALS